MHAEFCSSCYHKVPLSMLYKVLDRIYACRTIRSTRPRDPPSAVERAGTCLESDDGVTRTIRVTPHQVEPHQVAVVVDCSGSPTKCVFEVLVLFSTKTVNCTIIQTDDGKHNLIIHVKML